MSNYSSRNPHLKYDQFPIYGSDKAIQNLQPTYNMGNVIEPSRDELALMQRSPYILHAKNGILTKSFSHNLDQNFLKSVKIWSRKVTNLATDNKN